MIILAKNLKELNELFIKELYHRSVLNKDEYINYEIFCQVCEYKLNKYEALCLLNTIFPQNFRLYCEKFQEFINIYETERGECEYGKNLLNNLLIERRSLINELRHIIVEINNTKCTNLFSNITNKESIDDFIKLKKKLTKLSKSTKYQSLINRIERFDGIFFYCFKAPKH